MREGENERGQVVQSKFHMIRHSCALLLVFIFTTGFSQKRDIVSGSLDEAGLKSDKINSLVDSIERGFFPNRHSLLIFKDNKLVLEKYFKGKYEIWGTDIGILLETLRMSCNEVSL